MNIKKRAARETDKNKNYLHPQFKYRIDYNLYSIKDHKYSKTSIVQIEREIETRKVSEKMVRIDRSVAHESNSKRNEFNNSNTDFETQNVKYQRGRECSERTITNISLINKIERNKIGRS